MASPILLLLFQWICASLAQNTTGRSVFISDGGDVAFGINIPNDNTTNIYFALRGHLSNTWTAVGLGQKDMKGALVFIMYQNKAGTNATLSTRISSHSVEPNWSPDFQVQALPGTGIDGAAGTLVFNGRCSNCRSWPGGSLDVTSAREPFIYAVGPNGELRSDDEAESVQYHAGYGWFTMDMTHAAGAAHIPELQKPTGSQVGKGYTSQKDLVAVIHGIVALVCFLGLFPFCIIILKVCEMPRLFKICQIISGIVALVGIAIGIYGGTYYNKTKSMSTPHQVLGLIVFAFILLQSILGCVYFPIYRRNKTSGNGNPRALHIAVIGFGWLTLLLGCINGFLGYPLAHHVDNNKIIGGVFAAVVVILFLSLALAHRHKAKSKREKRHDQNGGDSSIAP